MSRIETVDRSWRDDEPTRSARMSLRASIHRGVFGGLALWQVTVVVGTATTNTTVSPWLLVVPHLAIAVLAWKGRTSGPWAVAAFLGTAAVLVADFSAVERVNEPAGWVACWTGNLLMATPAVLIGGVLGFTAGVGAVGYVIGAMILARPEWTTIHQSSLTTGLAMVVAGAVLIRFLHRFADQADAEAADAMAAQHAVTVARTAAREAIDTARTLHDTAINTLAAIASGGAATSDAALVRRRCERDVTTLEQLLAGDRPELTETDLGAIGQDAGIVVRRSGPARRELERHCSHVPVPVLHALRAAGDEAVRNAARHAGVDEVAVGVEIHDDKLRIEVSDRGRGFDGAVLPGRGLERSVHARAAEVGADVRITSTVGEGTTVVLEWSPATREAGGTSVATEPDAAVVLTEAIRSRACWAWAAAVVGVGIVIEALNRPGQFTAVYPALGLVGLASLVSWWMGRGRPVGHELPLWWASMLVVLTPVVFVLGFVAVGYGEDVVYWQAIVLTPLLVLLLVGRRRGDTLVAAFVGLLVAVVVVTVVVAHEAPEQASLVVIGAAPQVGLFAGWTIFYRVVEQIAQRAEAARRMAAESRSELLVREAVQATRQRWQDAGAARVLEVFRDVLDGVDPQDPALQRRCAIEEQGLRQVMQLSPETVYLGTGLARALGEARERGVGLILRTGDVDAPGREAAELLGGVIGDAIATATPGSEVTVGLFGDGDDCRLLLVGGTRLASPPLPDGWTASRQRFGSQELLEVVWPRTVRRS